MTSKLIVYLFVCLFTEYEEDFSSHAQFLYSRQFRSSLEIEIEESHEKPNSTSKEFHL